MPKPTTVGTGTQPPGTSMAVATTVAQNVPPGSGGGGGDGSGNLEKLQRLETINCLDRVMDLINLILEGYSNYERFDTPNSTYEHFTSTIPLSELSISKDFLSRIFNKKVKYRPRTKNLIYPSESPG